MAKQTFLSKTVNGFLPGEPTDNKLFSAPRQPMELEFENGQKAYLDIANPQATVWTKMIGYLQQNNRPVYVEADAGTIQNVYMPQVARVWEIWDTAAEKVRVSFYTSTAQHYLDRAHPDFQKMLQALQHAAGKGITLLVTSLPVSFEIIDVSELPAGEASTIPAGVLKFPEKPVSKEQKTVTPERAKALFNSIKWKSCIPDASGDPCIPFLYPSNGCWIRAHLMSYFLVEEKETPEKIWSFGKNLRARSSNVPGCLVKWHWHVAATLMVTDETGKTTKMVVDPSLTDEPVPVQKWLELQTDPGITFTETEWEYYRAWGGTATKEQANADMDEFRYLLEDMWTKNGFPPYECS